MRVLSKTSGPRSWADAWCAGLAALLARWSAGRLGEPDLCDRYREEFLANLDLVAGGPAKLAAAVGYGVHVPRMRRTLGVARPAPVRRVVIGMPADHPVPAGRWER